MSAHREQSTLKSAYLFEGTCHCRCCVDACNAVFTLNSITLYSTPCGSYKASDTELKQWAIYEARFELSNPPANTPQPQPAKKARAGPLDVLDAILGAPATTSSASATSLVDAELSVYLQADVISRAEPPTEWWAANAARYPLLAAEAKRYLSDCKNRIGIGDRK